MLSITANVPTKDDKYAWLDPDDKRRHMADGEILRLKLKMTYYLMKKARKNF